jgi:hypothetical protein
MKITGRPWGSSAIVVLAGGLFGASGCGALTGKVDLGGDRDSGTGASAGNTDSASPGTGGGSGSGPNASGGTNGNVAGSAGASGASGGTTGSDPDGASGTTGSGSGGSAAGGSGGSNGDPDSGSVESLWLQTNRGINDMKIDSTHLYWVTDGTYDPPSVWRAALQTGTPELLATIWANPAPTKPLPDGSRVYSLAIDDTHVFVTHTRSASDHSGGSIQRVPKQGGEVQTLVSNTWNPTSIAVDDTHAYFNVAASQDGEIRRVPKNGGPVETILTGRYGPGDIVVDSTHVYITELTFGYVGRRPKEGVPGLYQGGYDVISMPWHAPAGLALDGNWVYFVACDSDACPSHTMYRVPRAGTDSETFYTPVKDKLGPVVIRAAFIVSGRWLWPASGGAAINLLPAEQPTAVAANDDFVYLGVHATGKIYAVRSPLAGP